MLNLTIRLAVPSERAALEALQWRASLTSPHDREALLAHPDAIDLPLEQIESGAVFVAEAEGAVVGFAVVLPRPDGETELDGLFVEPVLQRRGIGRALVDHCIGISRQQKSTGLCVIGNPHAQEFYFATGFKLIGTAETRFGPGLLLRLGV